MSTFIIQLIRTVVPIAAGWLFAQLAALGLGLPPGTDETLISSLVVLFSGLYYAAIAWLEHRYTWFGWLLGIARRPEYQTGKHTA